MDYNKELPEFVESFKQSKGLNKIPLSYIEVVGKVLESAIKEKFSYLADKISVGYSLSQAGLESCPVAEYEIYTNENNDSQYICSMNCIVL
jgi:hypothetical protein